MDIFQEARALRAAAQSPIFAAALERVAWDAIFDLADSSSRQRLTFLKVKGLRLSGWDVAAQRRGCPHCALADSAGGGDIPHCVGLPFSSEPLENNTVLVGGPRPLGWDRLGLRP
jgi:hypothetical protein